MIHMASGWRTKVRHGPEASLAFGLESSIRTGNAKIGQEEWVDSTYKATTRSRSLKRRQHCVDAEWWLGRTEGKGKSACASE